MSGGKTERYAAHQPFPPYRHRPGDTPHPRRDIAGHSHGLPEPTSVALTESNWREHEAWLVGVDLFNGQYWWEAHEWWEAAWRVTEGPNRHLLQGLIQLAAAWLKKTAGNERGRDGLWRRAHRNLQQAVTEDDRSVGLDVDAVMATAEKDLRAADTRVPCLRLIY